MLLNAAARGRYTRGATQLSRNTRPSKVQLLPDTLTINGASQAWSYAFKGADATIASWSSVDNSLSLPLAGSGTDPTPNVETSVSLLGAADEWVDFNAGKIYRGSAGTGDITTEDFVIECIVNTGAANSPRWVSTLSSVNNLGYELKVETSGTTLRATIGSSGGTTQPTSTSALTGSTWYHIMAFCDRDENSNNSWRFYANGTATVQSSGHNLFVHSGLSLAGTALTLGANANSAAGTLMSDGLAWVAMWKRASWHPGGASNPTAWAAIATARYALLS